MFPPLCKIIWRITPLIPWSGLWHVPLWCRKLFNQWAAYILRHLGLNEQRAKSSLLSPDNPPKYRASAVEHDIFWSWGLWHGKVKRGYVWFSVVSFSTKWESEVSLIRYHQERIVHNATWTTRHKAKEENAIKNKPVSMKKKVSKAWGMVETYYGRQYWSSEQLAQMNLASQYLWRKP